MKVFSDSADQQTQELKLVRDNGAEINLPSLNVNYKIIDHNSSDDNLKKIDNIFKNFRKDYVLIKLDVSKFKDQIKKTNQRGDEVSLNQISNMANIHQSLLESKQCEDLIYFVEDDYIHNKNSISEMIFTYERVSSQIKSELVICPTDYPYLYTKAEATQNFLGHKYHWRNIFKY